MRAASPQFLERLEGETLTLARLWRFTPMNSATIFLTDHDQQVTYDGDDYLSATEGFSCSAISNQVGTGQTNFEIEALLGGVLVREDAERGLYSGASVEIDAIFYDHPEDGVMPLATGLVTAIQLPEKYRAVFSCAGFASTGQHFLTEVYSPTCRATFCDTRCGLDIADYTTGPFTVGTATGSLKFTASGLNATAKYYGLGHVTWVTGNNAGKKNEVLNSGAGEITLMIRPGFQIEVGDTFNISRGCDKTVASCSAYDNKLNFRGEPYVPGSDFINSPDKAKPTGPSTVKPDPPPSGWTPDGAYTYG